MATDTLAELEARLGLSFENQDLLRLALVHRSYLNEKTSAGESNERLEYLGDAVLGLLVADYLYKTYPDQSEGNLTDLRSALVRRETLAKWSSRFELGHFLFLGKGEAGTGGRQRQATLAAVFEAILGALFLERGLEASRAWLLPLVGPELEEIIAEGRHLNFKTRLQMEVQRRYHLAPVYQLVSTTGPEHAPLFEFEVRLADKAIGRGTGSTKQHAQQEAARQGLAALETIEN